DIRVNSPNINVVVNSGIVTLIGTVSTLSEKLIVADDTRHINGVIDIRNDLAVQPPQTFGDQEITDTVRGRLKRNAALSLFTPSSINVNTCNGVVTLSGITLSYAQKLDAGADARSTA